ncbi:unnamed protein product [Mytilus coruscus]|uniref:Uncharacterized protein n=1 Tax=Mytilus coruscus TaxID=42192 RepID=A0A6J8CVJ6_MYTCO|nr:unnamed protein product [Mytilus coruscus]
METSTKDKSDKMSNEILIKDRNDEFKTEKCRQKIQRLDLHESEETPDLNIRSGTKKFPNPEILNKPMVVSSGNHALNQSGHIVCIVQCTNDSIPAGIENINCGSWNPLVLSSSTFEDNLKAKLDKSIEDNLKAKLDKSIEDNNDIECEKLLETNTITKTLPIIVPGLDRAITSGNHKIVKIINSYICSNSSKIVSDFYQKYEDLLKGTSIWMGRACFCSKTDEKKYEEEICDSPKFLLIVDKNVEIHENFDDFPMKVITDSSFRSDESRVIAQRIIPESHQRLDRVPKSVAKQYFKKHSNLTMIRPSAHKSIGFETEEHAVLEVNCISLFCRIKGIIPIGEHHFPLKIRDVQTDVLEGTSYFTSAVHIGGFVKYYGIDTFLTCAHVIFGKTNISNLQNNVIHSNCHTISNDDATNPVKCTLIRHILKYDTQDTQSEADNNEETSIDAALLLIQIPNISVNNVATPGITTPTQGSNEAASLASTPVELRIKLHGHSVSTEQNLSALGLRSIYLNENFIDSDVEHSRAVALSAITGEQERLIGVRKRNRLFVLVPSHVRIETNHIMYNQFSIQNMDFEAGDSGTCIYAPFTGSEQKGCIGMLVGKSTSGECIVTPMKDILKALGVKP